MTQQPPEKPYLLFVEGKDDKAVVDLLLQDLNITSVEVYNVEGKDNFQRRPLQLPADSRHHCR